MFARKLIRIFGDVTRIDIENEARAIAKLCEGPGHRNIVRVLRHKWLGWGNYYFIDMELCEVNLKSYINGERGSIVEDREFPHLINIAFVEQGCSMQTKLLNIWTVMSHLAQGVRFIHGHDLAHRDLKPRNGI